MDWIIPLLSLSAMEIVLGIDNVIFIAILVAKLPAHQQAKARNFGLGLALLSRLALLFSISWVMGLKNELFSLVDWGIKPEWIQSFTDDPQTCLSITGKDLVLLIGGLFLIAKSVNEIHHKLEGPEQHSAVGGASFGWVIFQIIMIDVIFSLDSVITAVGMVDNVYVIVGAMLASCVVMMAFAGPISNFVAKHPTIKILALAFLILIGVMLVVEGSGNKIPKGYIYFAMAFSLIVELVNIRVRVKSAAPVTLHEPPPVGS